MVATIHLGIEVDTSSVKQATGDVQGLNRALDGTGGAAGRAGTATGRAGQQIKGTADVISLAEKRAQRAALEMRRLQISGNNLHGSLKGLRSGVQNAAFQFSDLSVQMGMGTAASTAFALQMPQLLQGFGILGAVLGTVAAIVIPLYRDGFNQLWASISATAKAAAETNPVLLKMAEAAQFLWQNIEHLVAISITFAAFMATKWVAGFVAARVATMTLVGALVALRTALIRTGIGAIIVLVGELGLAIAKIQKKTGDWGETFKLLGDVAAGVWEGIVTSAGAIPAGLNAVWQKVRADFLAMVSSLAGRWANFLTAIGQDASGAIQTMRDAGDAMIAADAAAAAAAADAKTRLVNGFEKARAAIKALRDQAANAGPWFDGMAGAAGDIEKGTGGAAKKMKEMEKSGKKLLEDSKAIADQWKAAHDGIVGALLALSSSQNVMDSLGGMFQGINSVFSDSVVKEFDKIAQRMTGAIQDAFGKMTGAGLSEFGASAIGMGIGNAAIGILNGSAKQVGSGIGSAIGGALGSSLTSGMGGLMGMAGGPIGMVLGGLLGGAIPGIFGGGRDYTRPTGVAFEGTALERRIQAREAFPDEEGNTAAAHIAYAGVVSVVKDFEDVLTRLVKTTTSGAKRMDVSLREGIDVMRAVDLITLEMDRRPTSSIEKGAEERAKRFQERMLEIVGIAQQVASVGRQPLTQAQVAWREFEAQFSAENVKILKAIGFSAKQLREAQREVGRDLARDFNKEMLDTLVDTGDATKRELDLWRNYELKALEDRRVAAVRTAREIGASVDLVQSSFKAQKSAILDQYKEMLESMSDAAAAVIEKLRSQIANYNTTLGRYDQRRSEILTELARRADETRAAEQELADARRSLSGSSLAPGGPMNLLNTLKSQFSSAIGSAKSGNAGAASLAASLAQDLLQQGQSVYASGSGYSDLFKFVNSQLSSAQTSLGGAAKNLEKRLDAENFSRITERNTAALLKALSSVNTSIKTVGDKIEALEKKLAAVEQKRRVA